jgi:hypothetical protein
MTPTFTTRGVRQHRYYVTRLRPGEDRSGVWRVPAGDIDRAVLNCVDGYLRRSRESEQLSIKAGLALVESSVPHQRCILLEHKVGVQLGSSSVIVTIGSDEIQEISITASLAKKGSELKLVVEGNDREPRQPDPVLLRLVSHARLAQQTLLTGEPDPLVSHYSKRHLWQLLRLSWLAPDIIAAITEGRQPATLTGRRLLRAADLPFDWEQQRRFLRFI